MKTGMLHGLLLYRDGVRTRRYSTDKRRRDNWDALHMLLLILYGDLSRDDYSHRLMRIIERYEARYQASIERIQTPPCWAR